MVVVVVFEALSLKKMKKLLILNNHSINFFLCSKIKIHLIKTFENIIRCRFCIINFLFKLNLNEFGLSKGDHHRIMVMPKHFLFRDSCWRHIGNSIKKFWREKLETKESREHLLNNGSRVKIFLVKSHEILIIPCEHKVNKNYYWFTRNIFKIPCIF